jgi:hypothetical protein
MIKDAAKLGTVFGVVVVGITLFIAKSLLVEKKAEKEE